MRRAGAGNAAREARIHFYRFFYRLFSRFLALLAGFEFCVLCGFLRFLRILSPHHAPAGPVVLIVSAAAPLGKASRGSGAPTPFPLFRGCLS